MAKGGTGNVVPSVVAAEHIGPEATGDNIEAKRVAVYNWNGEEWERMGAGLTPGASFDYIDVAATSSTKDTITFKQGGSGGTTVRTIEINYASADVSKVSDTFDNIGFS